MVEPQFSKLMTRVRSPSAALTFSRSRLSARHRTDECLVSLAGIGPSSRGRKPPDWHASIRSRVGRIGGRSDRQAGGPALVDPLKIWATRADVAMADLGRLSVLLGDMDS